MKQAVCLSSKISRGAILLGGLPKLNQQNTLSIKRLNGPGFIFLVAATTRSMGQLCFLFLSSIPEKVTQDMGLAKALTCTTIQGMKAIANGETKGGIKPSDGEDKSST